MILNDKVEIIGNSKNLKHFREKGYGIKIGEKIYVSVFDLSHGSTFKVDVRCDVCMKESKVVWSSYYKYTNNNKEEYHCLKCCKIKRLKTNQERYGGNSPTCSKEIVNKIKTTNQERYGNNSSLHGSRQEITEQIFLEKYGSRTPFMNEDIKEKIKKSLFNNYGVYSPLKSNLILEKVKETNLEKYGVDNVSKSEFIIDKIKQSNINKYGKDWYYQTNEFKEKSKKTCLDRYGFEKYHESIEHKLYVIGNKINNYPNIDIIDYKKRIFTLKCNDCFELFDIETDLLYKRNKDGRTLCTKCNKLNSNFRSSGEIEICKFLEENGLKFQTSVRNIIKGEMDIFLPDYNLAIEYNGIFWHSEYFKNKKYHFDKYKKCFDKNIQLIQIWEDEWISNKEKVKSIILSKLGIYEQKIWARKCELKLVDYKEKDKFLNDNHLQSSSKSSVNIGLYYNNEIVSLMTFGKRRINSKETYELIRYCNKKNTIVVGGASKIFKNFLDNYKVNKIVSYSDNNISNGDIYKKLNFNYLSENINYYWCDGKKRYHRFTFNKKRLISKGYNPDKSGLEIMRELGYYRIFGSGIKTWIYENNIITR